MKAWNLVQMKLLSCRSRTDLGAFRKSCFYVNMAASNKVCMYVCMYVCMCVRVCVCASSPLNRKIKENDLLAFKKPEVTHENNL